MGDSQKAKMSTRREKDEAAVKMQDIQNDYRASGKADSAEPTGRLHANILNVITFLEDFNSEVETALGATAPNPYLNMAAFLIREPSGGQVRNRLDADRGLRCALCHGAAQTNRSGGVGHHRTTSAHQDRQDAFRCTQATTLLESWGKFAVRVRRLAAQHIGCREPRQARNRITTSAAPTWRASRSSRRSVLPEPLNLPGGLRILVHGDPTFMVMDNLKRQFEQVIGAQIQPARLFHRPPARRGAAQRRADRPAATTSSPSICRGSASLRKRASCCRWTR